MQEGSFIWTHLEKQHRVVEKKIDWLWLILLLLTAVILFSINLGGSAGNLASSSRFNALALPHFGR
jgi:hypothetical protein